MGKWSVDTTTRPGILRLSLEGKLNLQEMAAFVTAHNRAIDSYAGSDYKVWCDISKLHTLEQDCAALLAKAKDYSNAHANFRGSAVLVASAMVAMQHRRTSIGSGVMSTELISEDVAALERHLSTVYRRSG